MATLLRRGRQEAAGGGDSDTGVLIEREDGLHGDPESTTSGGESL